MGPARRSPCAPDDLTVEHVLPRKLGADSHWRERFPTPQEREQCTESLGNLVLVTKAQNDKAGNLDFARKLKVYFETRGAPKLAINEALRGRTEWKAADVRAREMRLFELDRVLWSSACRRRRYRPRSEAGRAGPTRLGRRPFLACSGLA